MQSVENSRAGVVETSGVVFSPSYLTSSGSRNVEITVEKSTQTGQQFQGGGVQVQSEESLMETLDVNIVSIMLGALIFIVVIALVDFIKALCRGALESCSCGKEGKCRKCSGRYNAAYRKGWVALVEGLSSIFICILLYMWYKNREIKRV